MHYCHWQWTRRATHDWSLDAVVLFGYVVDGPCIDVIISAIKLIWNGSTTIENIPSHTNCCRPTGPGSHPISFNGDDIVNDQIKMSYGSTRHEVQSWPSIPRRHNRIRVWCCSNGTVTWCIHCKHTGWRTWTFVVWTRALRSCHAGNRVNQPQKPCTSYNIKCLISTSGWEKIILIA